MKSAAGEIDMYFVQNELPKQDEPGYVSTKEYPIDIVPS